METEAVFVDTSGWYALCDRADPDHPRAASAWAALAERGATLMTSDWVLSETVALLHRRLGRDAARLAGGLMLSEPGLRLLFVERRLLEDAWARFERSGAGVSLVDCTSFQLARAHGVRLAFAFDGNFAREGLGLVL